MSTKDILFAAAGVPTGGPADPDFKNVTLLLHGDGTNGAQNNTFLDSSSNNFTITRNGNTTQGSFSPYGDLWSNYFDGTGDYLSVARNSVFLPGASTDFTIEMWIYPISIGAQGGQLIGMGEYGDRDNTDWAFALNTDRTVSLYLATSNVARTTTATVNLNQWNHVAAARIGTGSNNLTIYINGVGQSFTETGAFTYSGSSQLTIGADVNGDEAVYNGYISNVRMINGSAAYTTNFTPPTAPLTAITNTALLTCQSNRFIDNSSNNFAITRNGDVSVQRFSPFSPTAAYDPATIGGSGYFDGSGDYLTAPSNSAFAFGTGDFAIEAWVYPQGTQNYNIIAATNSTGSGQAGTWWFEYSDTRGFAFVADSNTYTQACTFNLNVWTHVAVTRSGTDLRFFLNGVQQGSAQTVSNNLNTTATCAIGALTNGSQPFTGYISNARIVKGSAVYTSTFTPPTAPLTAITNTSLLCNFTNAGIFDNAMMNDLETVGNAQISTSVKKFGTGSMAFDGNGDRLVARSNPGFYLSSGDFTVEAWVYKLSSGRQVIVSQTQNTNSPYNGWLLYISSSDYITFEGTNGSLIAASTTFPLNQWVHVAAVRSSSTTTVYVNGSSVASGTVSITDFNGNLVIGQYTTPISGSDWNGYIDDLRITKGVARYTANFTPPTAPFEDQ